MSERTLKLSLEQERTPNAGFPRDRIERWLVLITAVTIALSLITERTGGPDWLILSFNIISYITGGFYGIQDGLASLRRREINVDLLMVLAAAGAASVNQWHEGAILLFLFSLSNVLQAYAIDRSRNAIRTLLDLRPDQVRMRRDGETIMVPIEQVQIGDVVVLRPGDRLPIDGEVIQGNSMMDQAAITGESMPVFKTIGDEVFAGSVNQNGSLDIRVTRPAQDSTLARIIRMVEQAQDQKAHTQQFIEAFEQRYALAVILGVLLFIMIPPMIFGVDFRANFYRAMVLLVIASPCALVISTPASILSAIANAARRGILFKGGAHMERMSTIKVVAFDKTGTITYGTPVVTDVITLDGTDSNELLALTASIESHSEHPIARAIVEAAAELPPYPCPVEDFTAVPGQGVSSKIDGRTVLVGTERLMQDAGLAVPQELLDLRNRLESEGKTVLLIHDGVWRGALAVADKLRENAADAIQQIHLAGVEKVIMLTGDNATVAAAIARRAGIDEYHAGLLPEQKVAILRELETRYGPVAMVGDGVNDAPALATAAIGVAMGAAGTDVALETADVVLMSDNLAHIAYAMDLSHKARRVVMQNLIFALGVIATLLISAFVLPLLQADLPLPVGVLGHEGSTLIVVANGLRLLVYRHP